MGHSVIHKCRKSETRGEFWCFLYALKYRLRLGFPNPKRYKDKEEFNKVLQESPVEAFLRVLEEDCPSLKGTLHLQLVRYPDKEDELEDRVFFSMKRAILFTQLLPLVITDDDYGSCDVFKGKVVKIDVVDSNNFSPTQSRVLMVCEILENVVRASGGSLMPSMEQIDASDAETTFHFCVSHKPDRDIESRHIFVGHVSCTSAGEAVVSTEDCKRIFSEELALMSEHRLDEETDVSTNNQESLTRASLMFAFINGNISKSISLKLDENITPFCKGAVFVLYNYCRMAHIIHKYKTLEQDGSYPPLPDVNSVDFSLLTKPEEWSMMYEFVICWPDVLKSTASDIFPRYGDFKIHKILEFLKSLASTFSAYYRRTRVLTEARPNLLPVLQARIYLILALMKVYKSALDVLGLRPVQNM
ncbi:hypothetical protein GE061_007286 [Apolygus lucorum]|uniref:DALR anticodon binding domain-containing protein n=1 Tax=Apolygus lucorum TaxID=248454 RepID=A0A6A4IZ26_APOLU|nr:hypothetical protein GE061_007286 [Apolygus lucorum]